MTDLKFTADHEWARLEGDVVTIGITDYAQDQLGELVYVELPETGIDVSAGQEVVVIESVKAAGDIKSPCISSSVNVARCCVIAFAPRDRGGQSRLLMRSWYADSSINASRSAAEPTRTR